MEKILSTLHPRAGIYYWKCDRSAAFHGTAEARSAESYQPILQLLLANRFPECSVELRPAGGQGNHITYIATLNQVDYFVRLEDGPENDDYIEVESYILNQVRLCGLATPQVIGVDASRENAPFAWQVLENIDAPDLNQVLKAGQLNLEQTAEEIGRAVATWQAIQPTAFGPFDPEALRTQQKLIGFHTSYADYFTRHLDRHVQLLVTRGFIELTVSQEIIAVIQAHRGLLDLEQGVLVHKDLALWNILGTSDQVSAYIDWDDSISGDPMDDLSLLGCFYDGSVLARAIKGYTAVRPLPENFKRRFWLHLLRNMLVKAVIRVESGYFDRDDNFFLIDSGTGGSDLKTTTYKRLTTALSGLKNNLEIETL
ncbi:phosphotransferase family protein [Coraliomargarita sp. W4R72]